MILNEVYSQLDRDDEETIEDTVNPPSVLEYSDANENIGNQVYPSGNSMKIIVYHSYPTVISQGLCQIIILLLHDMLHFHHIQCTHMLESLDFEDHSQILAITV